MNSLSTTWSSAAPALGNHLWQSTLFAAVAALLALTLRNYQARTRYWLWLAASAKFLIPFSLLLSIGSHLAWSIHPATSQPAMYAAIDQISQPFNDTVLPNTPIVRTAHPSALLPAALATAWLCGFIAVLAFWFIQLRRVSKAVCEAKPLQSGREIEILRRLEQAANLRNPIQLLSSRDSMEPGVFGILHPVLLWPEGISQHLDDAHLEAIIAHEVWHVQRRDNLTSTIHMLVEALFWFHPLVWWLEKRLVNERERACDESVLQLGKHPHVYAESILKVCEFCVEAPLSCVSGITGADLKKRMIQIMTKRIAPKLDFGRKLLLLAAGLLAIVVPVTIGVVNTAQSQAQSSAAALPSFEVAAIKPSNSSTSGGSIMSSSDRLTIENQTIKSLIKYAYKINSEDQVTGEPGWISSAKYNIEAKKAESLAAALQKLPPDQREEQNRLMVQSLLADRFKLKVHHETKELPVYALVVAKNGPKLIPATVTPPTSAGSHTLSGIRISRNGQLTGMAASPSQLAAILERQSEIGRLVIDKTGLAGKYDFTLQWTPASGSDPLFQGTESAESSSNSSGPSLFTALQEQLGLKLESTKGPVEVLVVDHIEPPSEN